MDFCCNRHNISWLRDTARQTKAVGASKGYCLSRTTKYKLTVKTCLARASLNYMLRCATMFLQPIYRPVIADICTVITVNVTIRTTGDNNNKASFFVASEIDQKVCLHSSAPLIPSYQRRFSGQI